MHVRIAACSKLNYAALRCRWLSFHHVWYSVDLPSGHSVAQSSQREGATGKPQLYLLNVSLQQQRASTVAVCISHCIHYASGKPQLYLL